MIERDGGIISQASVRGRADGITSSYGMSSSDLHLRIVIIFIIFGMPESDGLTTKYVILR